MSTVLCLTLASPGIKLDRPRQRKGDSPVGGLLMIRLHETRLMREGEVVLWLAGKIVEWTCRYRDGSRSFDTVTLHVSDGAQIAA